MPAQAARVVAAVREQLGAVRVAERLVAPRLRRATAAATATATATASRALL